MCEKHQSEIFNKLEENGSTNFLKAKMLYYLTDPYVTTLPKDLRPTYAGTNTKQDAIAFLIVREFFERHKDEIPLAYQALYNELDIIKPNFKQGCSLDDLDYEEEIVPSLIDDYHRENNKNPASSDEQESQEKDASPIAKERRKHNKRKRINTGIFQPLKPSYYYESESSVSSRRNSRIIQIPYNHP